jgi:hypothetical protein
MRAGDDSELSVLAVDQVEEGVAVQFLQEGETQQGPQMTLGRGTNKLVQILQVALEQFSGYSDGDVILRGSIATFHKFSSGGSISTSHFYRWPEKAFPAQRVGKRT